MARRQNAYSGPRKPYGEGLVKTGDMQGVALPQAATLARKYGTTETALQEGTAPSGRRYSIQNSVAAML
jgi:hypothetical protein